MKFIADPICFQYKLFAKFKFHHTLSLRLQGQSIFYMVTQYSIYFFKIEGRAQQFFIVIE